MKKKITKVLNHQEILELSKVAHIALEDCIYRVSNVEPHFINCVVDSPNSGPNWFLCHDIERFVATKLSIFVVASVIASCVMSQPVL